MKTLMVNMDDLEFEILDRAKSNAKKTWKTFLLDLVEDAEKDKKLMEEDKNGRKI